ncbi:MAG: response regulator [Desulfuromonas thiophila]|nr:response regulator [Desulfuromonas thiophila]
MEPVEDAEEAMETPTDSARAVAVDETLAVLCVDDEPSILKALRRLLQDDYPVMLANSGAEAIELLRQDAGVGRIGLILSDQRMPEMTGVEFLQQARVLAPQALRVMLTGYADLAATVAAVNQGQIWRYLNKPWDDEALLLLVRDGLRQVSLQRDNQRLQALVQAQNAELKDWNQRLKQRVLEQTALIRQKNVALSQSNRELRDGLDSMMRSLACLLEMRDQRHQHHSLNTAALVTLMAEALELKPAEGEALRAAALLHGIGKLGISDALLNKDEEQLNESQWREYLQYPVRGQIALEPIAPLRAAGQLIRHLLERYDGTGTPDGLAGEAIPLGSRILALAEYFDRQHSGAGLALDASLALVGAELGRRFDPVLFPLLVEAARELYRSFELDGAAGCRRELYPPSLWPGMVVLQDVYSGTGLLLLRRGTVLTGDSIQALKRYYDSDPPEGPVQVLCHS